MLYVLYRYNKLLNFLLKPLHNAKDITLVEVSPRTNPISRLYKSALIATGFIQDLPQKRIFGCTPFPDKISREDSVLLFDIDATPMVKWLEYHFAKGHVSVFFWRPITHPKSYFKNPGELDLCSFDFTDTRRYRMRLVKQFYRQPDIASDRQTYDFFYYGPDGGNLPQLEKMGADLEGMGYRVKMIVVSEKGNPRNYPHLEIVRDKIEYEDVRKLIAQSKVLLDVVETDRTDYTLRPIEALFWEKKVLTNDSSVRQLEFYSPNRFLIIRDFNVKQTGLDLFFDSPMPHFTEQRLREHDITYWIRQFIRR